jgi:hypothetical protein
MRKFSISMLVLAFLATAFGAGQNAGDGEGQGKQQRRPKFTVSKETTFVTGPRDEAGYIDYEAALNERLGKGVTAANNANVLLWKTFGPHPEGATMPGMFFHLMNVPPPEEGDYYIDLFRYIREHLKLDPVKNADKIWEQMERAGSRPWKAKEYSYLAAWLKVNEKPLATLVEATKRSHYFSPLVTKKGANPPTGLIGALLPGVQKCRDFAQALTVRAMLHLGEGRYDDAWQDLLALHRLGRLMAQGGTLIEGLVGIAIENIASHAELAILDHKDIDARRLKSCLRDLQKMPPMPAIADRVDLTERLILLENIVLLDRHGMQFLQRNFIAEALGNIPEAKAKEFLDKADWDPALRSVNGWMDRLAAAMRVPERAAREQQLEKFDKELKALKDKLFEKGELAKALADGKTSPAIKTKLFGDALICLLAPSLRKVQSAADRTEQIQRNLHVAFALGAYQREQGRYPKTLDALAPKYLEKIPQDLFTGKALTYRPADKGYLLYSFGPNGKDDGGRYYDDDPPGDDPRVRMPLPKLEKK